LAIFLQQSSHLLVRILENIYLGFGKTLNVFLNNFKNREFGILSQNDQMKVAVILEIIK
jgi:hypothetical protein